MREVVSGAADSAAATRQRNCARDGHVNKAFTDGGDNAEGIELGNTQHVGASTRSNALVGGIADPNAAADEDEAKECGCCMMRPLFLRRFRTAKWVLFWLCWAGAAQGMVVNGFVNVAISTIERRFGLRSAATGLIAGGYDVASFVCLLPVSFLGGRVSASKPVWLAGGVLILGLGSLVFASPHFLSESPYSHLTGSEQLDDAKDSALCFYNSTMGGLDCAQAETKGGYIKLSHWLWVFLLAQILHGVGASPLYTLGVTFIDESVSKKMSSVYLGVFYTTATLGPAVGYILGGQLLQIHADVGIIDVSLLGITPQSGVWVGAWWIGFILSAIICLIISMPLLAFPPSLPGAKALQAEKECEAHFGGNGDSNIGGAAALNSGNIRGLPTAFCSLIANPTFSFLNLAGALEGLLISGFAAFLPKVIENQLGVDASKAAFFMGMVTVPAGGGATLLGGYLIKHFNLRCSGIIKLCVISTALGLVFTGSFFLSCSDAPLAGISLPYKSTLGRMNSSRELDDHWSADNFSLNHDCNTGCGCTENDYNPICGADGLLYYSPCYAGCTSEKSVDGAVVYMNCECIIPNGRNLSISLPDGNTKEFSGDKYMAVNQLCKTTCNLLWPFMGLTFCVMFFTFLSTMPALSATLRCVESSQRSFALGIQWLTVRIFGTIPAPMIFGAVIDITCQLWQETSSGCEEDEIEEGACRHYDNYLMARYMVALAFVGKALALMFFYLAWRLYIPPPSGNGEEESVDKVDDEERKNFPQYRKISEEQQEMYHRNSEGKIGSFNLKTMNGHANLNSEGFI